MRHSTLSLASLPLSLACCCHGRCRCLSTDVPHSLAPTHRMDAQQLQELFAFADSYRPPEYQLPVRLQPFLPDYVSHLAAKPVGGCCHLVKNALLSPLKVANAKPLRFPCFPASLLRCLPLAHPTLSLRRRAPTASPTFWG